jgi:hypothetical protein
VSWVVSFLIKGLAMPIFYEMMSEKRFFLQKFLHFADSDSQNGEVPPKISKAKPLSDHLIEKFSESYIPEHQLSVGESPLL